jgi:hypothetical protein
MLPLELKLDGHDLPLGLVVNFETGFSVAGRFSHSGILEEGGIELRGLLGLAVKPQMRDDFLHAFLLACWVPHSLLF